MTLILLSLLSCAPPMLDVFCDSPTAQRWNPASTDELLQFPDDALTVQDGSSPTGLRVFLDPDAAWLQAVPETLSPMSDGVNQRSGFARSGAVVMRFTRSLGALPQTAQESIESPELMLVDLDSEPATRVPYTVQQQEAGQQMLVQPLRPLRPGARHALVLTRSHRPVLGECVAPSPTLQALLSGGDGGLRADVAEGYRALAERLALEPDDISAATVFTTHDDVSIQAQAAAHIRGSSYDWLAPPSCEPWGQGQRCQGQFLANDYRPDGDIAGPLPSAQWTLTATLWLPDAAQDAPLALYGHGINSSRGEARSLAERVQPMGLAVASLDALQHGDHPLNDASMDALAFLGITLSPVAIDGQELSRNFVQTNLDRLQLLELLAQSPDIDGDGVSDVDPEQLAYVGVSLGGLLGPGLLSLSERGQLGALPVGGGHLTTFATSNEYVSALEPLFIDMLGSEAAWKRFLQVGQTLMDPADPATLAAHVLRDRLDDRANGPHVLLPISVFDGTVPPATGEALARGLGLPQLEPVVNPVDLLEPIEGPLQGNLDGVTAAFFQLDRVTEGDEVVPSAHGNTPYGTEGELQLLHFIEGWMQGEVPEIVDPYSVLGTAPLP